MTHPSTTRARLAQYRRNFEKAVHKSTRGALGHRYGSPFNTPSATKSSDGKKLYTESKDQVGEYLGNSSDLIRCDFTGFYADNFQNDTIIGGVAKLRTPRGALYIPVTHCTGWDGSIHYIGDCESVPKGSDECAHENAIREAARSANHYAEREADQACEDDAKYQAEQQIEEAREHIHELNREALPLIREVKSQGEFSPAICRALKAQIQAAIYERAKAFRRIARLQADYWLAVPN